MKLKHLARRSVAALALVTTLSALSGSALAVTVDEVKTLAKLGIPEDQIIKTIEKDRTIFKLSVSDVIALKKAGVPDRVIKFMMATPAKFGEKSKDEPATTLEPEKTPGETEAERKAREERMRQEAQKLVEEKRKAEEAQRKAFAQGVLAKCRSLGDEGKYVEAIEAAQQFVKQGNFGPESEEAYFAKFCIANALVEANLLQSAARQLVDVVLAGPDRPFFQTAFKQLRGLRKKIDYSPPELQNLASVATSLSNFSQGFQDEFNYVMGEFFHEGSEWETAVAYLDAVGARSKDFAKAQYLKGFMEVQNDLFKSAVGSFQRAIVATEENDSAPAVRDLSFLALARIAYKIGDYDAAIYYYRKVPPGSYKQATAFYESAWVYFLKGDFSRALGTFHTLDSPYFDHYFYPEMWILEATAYFNLCHFDRTELALQRFEKDILPLITPLESFLKKTTKPEDFYNAVVGAAAGKKLYDLPPAMLPPVLSNVEFYNLYRTIKQIEREQQRLNETGARLGEYGLQLTEKLAQLRRDRIRQIGFTIRLILGDTLKEIQKFSTKHTELRIDLEDEIINEEERREAAAAMGDEAVTETEAEQSGATAIVGSDTWRWPFEPSEYWQDEIGSYRSMIADKCTRDQEGGL